MPLDHFVSQVHLRNFYSPALGNRMFALRKCDLKPFTPDAYSVCRIQDGSTNAYLTDERAVEEFLKDVEPIYNRAVTALATGKPETSDIYAVAGFVAYVWSCSPGGMRINSAPLRGLVEATGRLLDARGGLEVPPPSLGATSFSELLDKDIVRVTVDPKYPQAVGIAGIRRLANAFGNFSWEVLVNKHADSPYFTSDLPIGIEQTADPRIINRLVPLSPTVALRLRPNLAAVDTKVDFRFPHFRCKLRLASHSEVSRINSLLVQAAETVVFFRDNLPWVERLVQRYATTRIEPAVHHLPHGGGTVVVSTLMLSSSEPHADA